MAVDGDTLINGVDLLTGKMEWAYGDGIAAVSSPKVNYAHNLVFISDGTGHLSAGNQSRYPRQARPLRRGELIVHVEFNPQSIGKPG